MTLNFSISRRKDQFISSFSLQKILIIHPISVRYYFLLAISDLIRRRRDEMNQNEGRNEGGSSRRVMGDLPSSSTFLACYSQLDSTTTKEKVSPTSPALRLVSVDITKLSLP